MIRFSLLDVLQVLGWAQAMPKFANDLVKKTLSMMTINLFAGMLLTLLKGLDKQLKEHQNSNHVGGKHHSHSDGEPTRSLGPFAQDYRKLAIDCIKVLRVEMQLETMFHMQEMTNTEYLDDQNADEPDDFIISLTSQITRRDEEMAPVISNSKRNYIFGGICGVANASVKALADMKSINLFWGRSPKRRIT
ncbi:exocyst complex component SEC8-like isoform X2 [Trifolium pratense]|uniref:exocyst complex component SEC8-like isoform X2 n=1 Tax=Trifolium pratense TaxID=57577 RepID=UPI001E690D40|nr:exocyst complex component SEC8-like isoform X2 [Trifolium pratense]